MDAAVSQDVEERLKRVAGQVSALGRMLAEGRDLDEVLVQLSAAQAGLTEVGRRVVEERLHALLTEAADVIAPSRRRAVLSRATEIAARFSRGSAPARSTGRRFRR